MSFTAVGARGVVGVAKVEQTRFRELGNYTST